MDGGREMPRKRVSKEEALRAAEAEKAARKREAAYERKRAWKARMGPEERAWRDHISNSHSTWRMKFQSRAKKLRMTIAEYLEMEGLVWRESEAYQKALKERDEMKAAWEARQVRAEDLSAIGNKDGAADTCDGGTPPDN